MSPQGERFTARFWGVRGSIPTPGPDTVRYGGNTSCVEVWCGNTLFILDAGSGLRPLGVQLAKLGASVKGHIFLSHLHWDHIQGLPFFSTAYAPGNEFTIYGCVRDGVSLEQNLGRQMAFPNFPVPLSVMQSSIGFREVEIDETLEIGGAKVTFGQLNHPGGAMGVRIDYAGHSLAYCADHEHNVEDRSLNAGVDRLGRDTDLFIYDATYTDEEYPSKVGWGHSTWQVACRLAAELNVKRLAIFHHDPSHDDEEMDAIGADAQAAFAASFVAREGLELDLLKG